MGERRAPTKGCRISKDGLLHITPACWVIQSLKARTSMRDDLSFRLDQRASAARGLGAANGRGTGIGSSSPCSRAVLCVLVTGWCTYSPEARPALLASQPEAGDWLTCRHVTMEGLSGRMEVLFLCDFSSLLR